ncbi:hypothetical protein FEM33_21030 [Dyadobacter flavalbus]|uniref:Type II toxin-antitoxin system RelE/ParE family toxin n=1 Tax=Dyadobacter flavalbus TaxID=2579942 RepID=A0A5M8QN37_9BACT|nr:hypothetical protein FEM33_21030 [Dyadobacter flavalbus]
MPDFQILLSSHAIQDIEESMSYYEEKLMGLGLRFYNQVESTINQIARNPFIYSVKYESIRCANVWKFPFLIHFSIDESFKIVTILAVYNTYQRPLWDK